MCCENGYFGCATCGLDFLVIHSDRQTYFLLMIREVFQMILYTYLCLFILLYGVVAWKQVSNLQILSQLKKTLFLSASDDVKNDILGYLFTNLQVLKRI